MGILDATPGSSAGFRANTVERKLDYGLILFIRCLERGKKTREKNWDSGAPGHKQVAIMPDLSLSEDLSRLAAVQSQVGTQAVLWVALRK